MDFDYFMELEREGGMGNLAILDIDGSYTNNQKFQSMNNEQSFLRTLNNLKNRKISKYDYAYVEQVTQDDEHDKDWFVEAVRQTFFSFLKPFLKEVNKCIDTMDGKDDSERVFAKYFDQEAFLEKFGSENEDSY
jgi:hypothetical protein